MEDTCWTEWERNTNQSNGRMAKRYTCDNMLFWHFILVLCVSMAMFPPYVFDCVTSGCRFHRSGQNTGKNDLTLDAIRAQVIFFFFLCNVFSK